MNFADCFIFFQTLIVQENLIMVTLHLFPLEAAATATAGDFANSLYSIFAGSSGCHRILCRFAICWYTFEDDSKIYNENI